MDTLIAHITFNQTTGTYTSEDTSQIREIDAFLTKPDSRQAKDISCDHGCRMTIFPDCGGTICLMGIKYLVNMGMTMNNLI